MSCPLSIILGKGTEEGEQLDSNVVLSILHAGVGASSQLIYATERWREGAHVELRRIGEAETTAQISNLCVSPRSPPPASFVFLVCDCEASEH